MAFEQTFDAVFKVKIGLVIKKENSRFKKGGGYPLGREADRC